jgi:hypothetical protein
LLIELSFDVPGSKGTFRLLGRDFNIGKLQDDMQSLDEHTFSKGFAALAKARMSLVQADPLA